MRIRTSIIAAGAAAILGTTGALLGPAVASAHSDATTLKFISVQKSSIMFSKTSFGQQDTDVSSTGKTVGFDMLNITATSATSGSVNITGNLSGGFLYGTGTINFKTGAFTNGKVAGGTGKFKGATGTITTKTLSKTKTAVTIVYSG